MRTDGILITVTVVQARESDLFIKKKKKKEKHI